MKWIATGLLTTTITIGGYLYGASNRRAEGAEAAINKRVDELSMKANLHDSSIARLNSFAAVNTQWQISMEKKIDLLLRKSGIPEYLWPSVEADTSGVGQ